MRNTFLLLAMLLVPVSTIISQPLNKAARDSIWRISARDHQMMMELLGIDSLRPGVNGMDPNAPDAANYDVLNKPLFSDRQTGRPADQQTSIPIKNINL
jgi:hypothetical protein